MPHVNRHTGIPSNDSVLKIVIDMIVFISTYMSQSPHPPPPPRRENAGQVLVSESHQNNNHRKCNIFSCKNRNDVTPRHRATVVHAVGWSIVATQVQKRFITVGFKFSDVRPKFRSVSPSRFDLIFKRIITELYHPHQYIYITTKMWRNNDYGTAKISSL